VCVCAGVCPAVFVPGRRDCGRGRSGVSTKSEQSQAFSLTLWGEYKVGTVPGLRVGGVESSARACVCVACVRRWGARTRAAHATAALPPPDELTDPMLGKRGRQRPCEPQPTLMVSNWTIGVIGRQITI
jgi:hypothetical protein